jgi:hypothetical protein
MFLEMKGPLNVYENGRTRRNSSHKEVSATVSAEKQIGKINTLKVKV